MIEDLILSIYSYYSSHLPEDWAIINLYFKFDGNFSRQFDTYENMSGELIRPPLWLSAQEDYEVENLFRQIAKALQTHEMPTHIELSIKNSGSFSIETGYGDVSIEHLWPEDIKADVYTYSSASKIR